MIVLSKMSENIRELMAEKELDQVSLSKVLHTGRTKFSDILNGKNAPNFRTLLLLVEYFHCSADFVLGLTEYPKEEAEYKPAPPFGERLRVLLREAGQSQYRFVNDTGISWSVFYHWLTGKCLPSADSLVRIAEHLGCSVDHVLGRV